MKRKEAPSPKKTSGKKSGQRAQLWLGVALPAFVALLSAWGKVPTTLLVWPSGHHDAHQLSSSSSTLELLSDGADAYETNQLLPSESPTDDSITEPREKSPISSKVGHYSQDARNHWDQHGQHYWTASPSTQLTTRSRRCPSAPVLIGAGVDVNEVIDRPYAELLSKNRALVLKNGENIGALIFWDPVLHKDCLYELGELFGATALIDRRYLSLGFRLYSLYGEPIKSAEDIAASKNIIYLLLDGQNWVWPGIRPGYVVEVDGVVMRTVSLAPKVFQIDGFFTDREAEAIIAEGAPHLAQSVVVEPGENKMKVAKYRTSHTAFLPPSNLTRDFQFRSTHLLRLPNPGYAERLQYVRYLSGQYYTKHTDYFEKPDIIPDRQIAFSSDWRRYLEWAQWAQTLVLTYRGRLAKVVQEGEELYPQPLDLQGFQWALLSRFTAAHPKLLPETWAVWLKEKLENRERNIVRTLVEAFPWVNEYLEEVWRVSADSQLVPAYSPKPYDGKRAHPISQLTRWVRWARNQVAILGNDCPPTLKPDGPLHPRYDRVFVTAIGERMMFYLDLWEAEGISEQLQSNFSVAIGEGPKGLSKLLIKDFRIFKVLTTTLAREGGPAFQYSIPAYVPLILPNRFATIFLYLSDVRIGGETVFPKAQINTPRPYSANISELENTLPYCLDGAAVPSRRLTAALFYNKLGDGSEDPLSLHTGCPPGVGEVKHASNSFVWDAPAHETNDFWGVY